MSTVVRIAGVDADCDELVRLSPVEPCAVWRKGELKFPDTKQDGAKFESSGIAFVASDAGFDEYEIQVDESTDFLDHYFGEIKSLTCLPGIDTTIICFGLKWYNTFTQTDLIPAKLVSITGQLGLDIVMNHYPISDDDDKTTG